MAPLQPYRSPYGDKQQPLLNQAAVEHLQRQRPGPVAQHLVDPALPQAEQLSQPITYLSPESLHHPVPFYYPAGFPSHLPAQVPYHHENLPQNLPHKSTSDDQSRKMPGHKRGPWSQNEDAYLVALVQRNGAHNWVRISQDIATRSPKQCRERYHQNLKPSLNHDPITPEEGELIERMVNEMGKRWAEIARRLKGRSDNAVKNWWNGGQNRRKRNPERPQQMQPPQSAYPYAQPHSALPAPQQQQSLPGPQRSLRLPEPHRFEPYRRPQPLELQHHSYQGRSFETPMPSPSGYSVGSAASAEGAPSLVTDNGSEARSPRSAQSPLDLTATLAPLVGSRDERKNSSTRFLPQTGFAVEDDDHSAHLYYESRRHSVQLPSLPPALSAPIHFREPNFKPQLLTQPMQFPTHHHSLPTSATPVSTRQLPLPAYHPPSAHPHSPNTASPLSRQLPAPVSPAKNSRESTVAPTSPNNAIDSNLKAKMDVKSILS